MSQGARTKIELGVNHGIAAQRVAANAAKVETTADKWDRIVGQFCTYIVAFTLIGLAINAAFGGI